ncbi:unnamed protein product [Acanthoscelides obtectus]|uniref:CUB domain-containing protein n=1 Tax=Acanthoscelides obtectus TaxID=200917 RepID=A0A9P0JS28_ACAOB|nr:unnamed protein product [Acanthoscelides obtectus]CAK1663760.1 hypothetical protein AOBTE_LOCUS23840 [Acanthoscelides obtectus]
MLVSGLSRPESQACNTTYYGAVGVTYEMEVKRPTESQMPFLCYLNFTTGGGALGELVQLSFESFAVGSFESFTSGGCPEGHISIRESNRPATGGKWCGSAWGYTVYYSETSNVNLTLFLDKLPQQGSENKFEFKLSYKFLKLSDARIRYGNATQRSYRGKLSTGTYCDRLLEGCSRRTCRIQSPNYPGVYPRNVTCTYRVRERNVPPGKHALIAVRQANYRYKERGQARFDNSDRVLRVWDQCNMMQDFIEILDGWGSTATTLAHLCSGETIPEIISSGPELLVKFQTSPFGNPFHPLPISYIPGFELEIEVIYVNKESPTYIEHGKKCEFIVSTFDSSSGYLKSPLHSLPPNTTCQYHFRGQSKNIIWISFIKYHVTNERQTDFNSGECDVQLQIWDGDVKSEKTVPLIGQFCKDDKPKLCDHSLLKNSSRLTRPCGLAESYVSTHSDLTISHSIKYGSVLYPVNFILRYEFVDLSQEGVQMTRNPCDRLFKTSNGRFYSPRITFLFGRGGQKDLSCTYQFESSDQQRLKITFNKAQFGSKDCYSTYDQEANRWECNNREERGVANIKISEYPWKDVEIKRHCFCHNITESFTVITKTSNKVIVQFTVTEMRITEDHNTYFFDANFEFIPNENNCLNPWKNRRLRGSSGEITIRNNEHTLKQNEERHYHNQSSRYCLQQPWLIEPEEDSNFIYLKIKGTKKDSRLCASKNRILVYPAGRTEDAYVICPHYENVDDVVEMFSDGWSLYSYRKLQSKNSRSFIIEFSRREMGNFVVTWMEVSKNPALALPTSLLMIAPPDCPHSCPELGACISSELWCDGLRHCPSGNDEQESNCSIHGLGISAAYLNQAALSAVGLTAVVVIAIASFYVIKHWRHEQKNVIVSVTEHTFLEFKSGLC